MSDKRDGKEFPALDRICITCDGFGRVANSNIYSQDGTGECVECKGSGEVLTPFSEAVVELIGKRFLGVVPNTKEYNQ